MKGRDLTRDELTAVHLYLNPHHERTVPELYFTEVGPGCTFVRASPCSAVLPCCRVPSGRSRRGQVHDLERDPGPCIRPRAAVLLVTSGCGLGGAWDMSIMRWLRVPSLVVVGMLVAVGCASRPPAPPPPLSIGGDVQPPATPPTMSTLSTTSSVRTSPTTSLTCAPSTIDPAIPSHSLPRSSPSHKEATDNTRSCGTAEPTPESTLPPTGRRVVPEP